MALTYAGVAFLSPSGSLLPTAASPPSGCSRGGANRLSSFLCGSPLVLLGGKAGLVLSPPEGMPGELT